MRPRLLAVALLIAASAACSRAAPPSGTVTVLVTQRALPVGKLVASAVDDGSITPARVPAAVAPEDAVTKVDDIACLVPTDNIPAGAFLRRSMFASPKALGLDKGLTDQTARPTSC